MVKYKVKVTSILLCKGLSWFIHLHQVVGFEISENDSPYISKMCPMRIKTKVIRYCESKHDGDACGCV